MASTLIKRITPYCIALLILCGIFFIALKGYLFQINHPLVYSSDGLFSLAYVKTVIDTGWALSNPYLGYPGMLQLYDYPGLDNFSFLIQNLISFWSHNPFIVTNCFYLLTFIMSAFSALYVYGKLGLSKPWAIVAGVLFAILPYHFWRSEGHLYLSAYFAVPLWLLLTFWILDKDALFCAKTKYLNYIALFALLCIIVNTGVYYTFFGLFYVFSAGLIARLQKQGWAPFGRSLIIVLLSTLIAALSLTPNLIFAHLHGKNSQVAHRGFDESEVLGLELTQLLLPAEGHRLPNFAHVRNRYDKETAQIDPKLINENSSASLGLLGSFGFLASLAIIFGTRARKRIQHIYNAALLNLAGFLLATLCGFGTLFAMFISPDIRSYNRISVFLGFLSLLVLFKLIQYLCDRYCLKTKWVSLLACILLIVGIIDQTPTYAIFPESQSNQADFQNDQTFIANIEKSLPPGSAIFELPYQAFPETPAMYKMPDYAQFRPYLHSTNLRWSYAAMKGRSTATWQQKVAHLPTAKMLEALRQAGFTGIYINREGYADHGVVLEHSLAKILHQKPLVSPNTQLSFFRLGANS